MTPSIKEALERLIADIEDYERVNNLSPSPGKDVCWQSVADAKAALATLSPPAGERREAIARLIEELLDAACAYEQHFSFVDGKYYLEELKEARRALNTAIDNAFASGLVQDEAGWRDISTAPKDGRMALVFRPLARMTHDEPVSIKQLVGQNNFCWPATVPAGSEPYNPTNDGSCHVTHWMPLPAPPIRSARDGGAES